MQNLSEMVIPTVSDQPEPIFQLFVEGAQEMLGLDHFQHVLDLPQTGLEHTPVVTLPIALEQHYGAPGGRGLAVRIGRSAFKYLLQRRGDAMGLTSAEFRLQRAPQRMRAGLHLLAQQLIQDSGDRITIQDSETHWVWRSENCPVCTGRSTGDASCYLTVGLIQEFLAWSGGGRFYRVTERECRAAGASTCAFWIEKKPLD